MTGAPHQSIEVKETAKGTCNLVKTMKGQRFSLVSQFSLLLHVSLIYIFVDTIAKTM